MPIGLHSNKVNFINATDIESGKYNSVVCVSSNIDTLGGDYFFVVYTLVYTKDGEVDPLLGPVLKKEPEDAVAGDYWYCVNEETMNVVLKKYDGTVWIDSSDTQVYSYYWNMVQNGVSKPFGESAKVKIIRCRDFTTTATFSCEVLNKTQGVLTRSSINLTDVSDPIVSNTQPTDASNGQIWIKQNENGSYVMFVYSEHIEEYSTTDEETGETSTVYKTVGEWLLADADTRNKVYTKRPSSYSVGDLWITNSDTDHGVYLQGTLLQATVSRAIYHAEDWSPTLKYDSDLADIQNTLDDLSQYVDITSEGLRIGAVYDSGELSPFTSLFTSTELSFYQNSEKLLTLANNKLTAPKIEVDEIIVKETFSFGNLRLIEEDNGSFSFVVSS